MAVTSRGYPYPDNPNASADGPEAFRVLAEAINTDVTTVAAGANFVAKTAIAAGTFTVPASALTATAAASGTLYTIPYGQTFASAPVVVAVRSSSGASLEWTVNVTANSTTTQFEVYLIRRDKASTASTSPVVVLWIAIRAGEV